MNLALRRRRELGKRDTLIARELEKEATQINTKEKCLWFVIPSLSI